MPLLPSRTLLRMARERVLNLKNSATVCAASQGCIKLSILSPRGTSGGGPRRGETNKNAPPLPSPLLHPTEEREKSRSLMQPRAASQHSFCV
jgi:hypothetical protein